ncbi:hypothetical protein Nmel_011738 [Mimus melanotis]
MGENCLLLLPTAEISLVAFASLLPVAFGVSAQQPLLPIPAEQRQEKPQS